MIDPLADLAAVPLEALLASVDNALRNGSDMNNANLAFEVLCDRLGVDREALVFDPRWSQPERPRPGADRCPCCGGRAATPAGLCVPCAASGGFDPPCGACKADGRGERHGLEHVATCGPGRKAAR